MPYAWAMGVAGACMLSDPQEELARAFFQIPEAFRRPDDALYAWLKCELAARQVQGIILATLPLV